MHKTVIRNDHVRLGVCRVDVVMGGHTAQGRERIEIATALVSDATRAYEYTEGNRNARYAGQIATNQAFVRRAINCAMMEGNRGFSHHHASWYAVY